MVTQEFIQELRRVKDQFTWKLLPDDRQVPDRRTEVRLRARAEPKVAAHEGLTMDPIGAVCFAMTQELYDDQSWQAAANSIGLSLISAADLVAAANDRTRTGNPGSRQPDDYLVSLRTQLLEAVDLNPL